MDIVALESMIKIHEGFSSRIYTDETGHSTVGYGHNLDASDISYSIPLSMEDAESLLEDDIKEVLSWITTYPWWNQLSDNRQMSLVDMAFNMGRGDFSDFHKMINALADGDYNEAANQMRNSTWYNQVTGRAKQDILLMLKG